MALAGGAIASVAYHEVSKEMSLKSNSWGATTKTFKFTPKNNRKIIYDDKSPNFETSGNGKYKELSRTEDAYTFKLTANTEK